MRIFDNFGILVVEFKYGAWGRPMHTTATLGQYIGQAGVTAFLPGSDLAHNIASNVITTGISCIEKTVQGKEIDWQDAALKTVAGVAIDIGVGKAFSETESFVDNKIIPKNDSTYKHTLSTRYPNITRQEVYNRMRFRGTVARGINACTRFSAYSVRAALPV